MDDESVREYKERSRLFYNGASNLCKLDKDDDDDDIFLFMV